MYYVESSFWMILIVSLDQGLPKALESAEIIKGSPWVSSWDSRERASLFALYWPWCNTPQLRHSTPHCKFEANKAPATQTFYIWIYYPVTSNMYIQMYVYTWETVLTFFLSTMGKPGNVPKKMTVCVFGFVLDAGSWPVINPYFSTRCWKKSVPGPVCWKNTVFGKNP